MDSEKRTGIQISQKSSSQEISIVGGGIKIKASEKPIATNFSTNFAANAGWLYIMLDCSGSMRVKQKIDQAKLGIIDFAKDAFKKGYRVGLIKFSDEAELLCEPTNNIETLQNKIKDIKAVGSTNMTAAIKAAHEKLKDLAGARVMVIATDGMPDNIKSSLGAAAKAKADGIEIITIGTDDAEKEFLKKLASRTELSTKVSSNMLAQAISGASLLLPGPKSIKPR
jgi:Mg-chelatase subunit ChlD